MGLRDRTWSMVQRLARTIGGDYALNRVYRLDVPGPRIEARSPVTIRPIDDVTAIRNHPEGKVRSAAGYGGTGAWGYSAWIGDELAGVCWVWSHQRFKQPELWTLEPGERMLVDIVVASAFRGRGIASSLISHAAHEAARADCRRMYAWIWWSNTPSIRAFEKSGWKYVAFAYRFSPIGRVISGRLRRKS